MILVAWHRYQWNRFVISEINAYITVQDTRHLNTGNHCLSTNGAGTAGYLYVKECNWTLLPYKKLTQNESKI